MLISLLGEKKKGNQGKGKLLNFDSPFHYNNPNDTCQARSDKVTEDPSISKEKLGEF